MFYIAPILTPNLTVRNSYVMVNLKHQFIDLSTLRENTLGNVSIEKEIMLLFIDMIDDYVATLYKELPNKNWQALYEATHKIKPNIDMFGIHSLESTIIELETSFKYEKNLDTIEAPTNLVASTFKEVKKEIQLELNSMQDA